MSNAVKTVVSAVIKMLSAKYLFPVVLLALLLVLPSLADAQCAMCNETARTSTADNQENARALNNGILYLMAIPYILLLSIGFLFWKFRRSSRTASGTR